MSPANRSTPRRLEGLAHETEPQRREGPMSLAVADGRSVDDLDAIQADLIRRGVEY
jgi:hypothetical protein